MARFLLYLFCLAQLVIAVLPLARVVVFQGLSGEIFGTSEGAATLVMNMPVVASGFWLIGWLSLALLSYGFARLLAQQARMMKSLEKLPAREASDRETSPRESRVSESRTREEPAPEEPRRERKAHREPPLTDAPPLTDEETEETRSRRLRGLRNEKPARQDKQRREPILGTPGSANDER